MNIAPNPIASAHDVDATIERLAREIIADYPTTPLFVVLLRGGMPFAAKLMFAISQLAPDYHPELDYMVVSTYGQDRTAKQPVIVTDIAPDTDVKGRDVVIIDDVIDQGITSEFVAEAFGDRGAKSVRLAVLVNKAVSSRTSNADYIGFEARDQWLIGMGLDDAKSGHEHYRWTESIAEVS